MLKCLSRLDCDYIYKFVKGGRGNAEGMLHAAAAKQKSGALTPRSRRRNISILCQWPPHILSANQLTQDVRTSRDIYFHFKIGEREKAVGLVTRSLFQTLAPCEEECRTAAPSSETADGASGWFHPLNKKRSLRRSGNSNLGLRDLVLLRSPPPPLRSPVAPLTPRAKGSSSGPSSFVSNSPVTRPAL